MEFHPRRWFVGLYLTSPKIFSEPKKQTAMNRCRSKKNAWYDGYHDALEGKLFDDDNQFHKDAYAAGYQKGTQHSTHEDDWLPYSVYKQLVREKQKKQK